MMYFLYDFFLTIASVFAIPYFLWMLFKRPDEWMERLGFIFKRNEVEKCIWIHCASVGEVSGAAPLVAELKKKNTSIRFLLSTMTVSGKERARDIIRDAERIFIVPLDLWWVLRAVMRKVKPSVLILMETEIWPNLIRFAKRNGAKVFLVNGRITNRGYKRYRMAKLFFKSILEKINVIEVQSEMDFENFLSLGVKKEKLSVAGNLKFEYNYKSNFKMERERFRSLWGLDDGWKVMVAGSTRPGEEEILLDSWKNIKSEISNAVLLIAPRHKERFVEVEELIRKNGWNVKRRSEIKSLSDVKTVSSNDILLLDTIGELSEMYAMADVAFVGGSLVALGGHNPLEPALFGIPVIFGPSVENTMESADLLITSGGGILVENAEQINENVCRLFKNENERKEIGESAREVINGRRTMMEGTLEKILKEL